MGLLQHFTAALCVCVLAFTFVALFVNTSCDGGGFDGKKVSDEVIKEELLGNGQVSASWSCKLNNASTSDFLRGEKLGNF